MWIGPWEVIILLLVVGTSIPAFVAGLRLGVPNAWLAFIPLVGAPLVILWSIGRPGWLCILSVVPIVSLFFGIWLVIVVPQGHGRSQWWTLPFLIPLVQTVAFFVYAFTLADRRPASSMTAA